MKHPLPTDQFQSTTTYLWQSFLPQWESPLSLDGMLGQYNQDKKHKRKKGLTHNSKAPNVHQTWQPYLTEHNSSVIGAVNPNTFAASWSLILTQRTTVQSNIWGPRCQSAALSAPQLQHFHFQYFLQNSNSPSNSKLVIIQISSFGLRYGCIAQFGRNWSDCRQPFKILVQGRVL